MKIAYTASHGNIAKHMASLFDGHEFHIVTVPKKYPDMGIPSESYNRNIFHHFEDEEINWDYFDVLIDVSDTVGYCQSWRDSGRKIEIPRVLFIQNPIEHGNLNYLNIVHKNYPIVYCSEYLSKLWGWNGQVIRWTSDEWGMGSWTGEDPQMIYNRNDYSPQGYVEELKRKLGVGFILHDYAAHKWEENVYCEYKRKKRVHFEHCNFQENRSMSTSLIEDMALGLPICAFRSPFSEAYKLINEQNGKVVYSIDEAVDFANNLFKDYDLAKEYSKNVVEYYKENLCWDIARPKWFEAIQRAKEAKI